MVHFNSECHTTLGHVFHPFCSSLSWSQTVGYSIASGIIGGFSGGLSHLFHHFNNHSSNPLTPERVSLLSNESKSSLEELEEGCFQSLKEKVSEYNINAPKSEDISDLIEIYENEYLNLQNELFAFGIAKNPWKEKKHLQQVDVCIKLAFLIAVAILKNLDNYISEGKGKHKNRVEALTRQDNLRYRYSLILPDLYHFVRGSFTYKKRGELACFTLLKPFVEENKKSFYQKGTPQEQWRILYNTYCAVIFSYVEKSELQLADDRFIIWTQGDFHPCSFTGHPGTRPS